MAVAGVCKKIYIYFFQKTTSPSMKYIALCLILTMVVVTGTSQNEGVRDYGIEIGVFRPGEDNAITDVKGVTVGHTTLIKVADVRTGVRAILSQSDDGVK